ncbi:hypothetical protein NUW58_g9927 [Xylaria curta]|uniref:Uncharacterized protein n=1 Tax=Xylaria curta TaxID=42375 RepID=A0ACC1MRM9_9PEZI|nr:hypothetical protein NUW58_g9927 [Xylaria curta]
MVAARGSRPRKQSDWASHKRLLTIAAYYILRGSVEVIIYDDNVVNAGGVGILELDFGLIQAFGDGTLVLSAATPEPLLQILKTRWLHEDEPRVYAAVSYLLHALSDHSVSLRIPFRSAAK